MFGVFLITLRKEFKELFCSFHSWICFFFIVIFPFLALLKGIDFPSYAFVLVVAVSVCQYTYDSFQNDTESKGAVFLSNIKADFRTVYSAKLIVALVEGLICFCYGYRWIKDLFRFKDILWLSLALICVFSILQIAANLANGSEILAFALAILVCVALSVLLAFITRYYLRLLISAAAAFVSILLARASFHSLRYRVQF